MSDLTIATIIFVATYAVIISERLDRAVVALAGAGLTSSRPWRRSTPTRSPSWSA